MAGKRCAPGFQRAENRYFDIKWRRFRIFRTIWRFDGNAARLTLGAYLVLIWRAIRSMIEFAEQQIFHQRLLDVQSVFGFVPHYALRPVDHLSAHFLAPVAREAVHEEGVWMSARHHLRVDAPVSEGFLAHFVLGFETHAGPDVGRDEVGAGAGVVRIGEFFIERRAVGRHQRMIERVAWRRGQAQFEAENLCSFDPRVQHVVRVADPGHGFPRDGAAQFVVGEDVGQDLTWVIFVRQTIDHRHARIFGEALEDVLAERADHDDVDHARHHLRRIFDRFAAAELRVSRAEEHGVAAKLEDPRFEREPRTRRILLEDHRQRAVVQRMVGLVALELALENTRAFEHVVIVVEREILELQVVANFFFGHENAYGGFSRQLRRTAPPSWWYRISA